MKLLRYLFAAVISLFVFVPFLCYSQAIHPVNAFGYRFLDYDENYMPDDLLSTRTAVFVVAPNETNRKGTRWKNLAEEAHKVFQKTGIDAVAYFRLEDVLSGKASLASFTETLNQRKIKNLVLLSETVENGSKSYAVIITTFNGKTTLVDQNQKAWLERHEELDRALLTLYRALGLKSSERKNLLILDQPEYFTDTRIIAGRRFETYQQDLKLDKLAVPLFSKYERPENYPAHPLNDAIAAEVDRLNRQTEEMNERLANLMQQYPFKYELIDIADKTQEQLRNDGFQFIFNFLHTSGQTIKRLLDYNMEQVETDYVTVSAKGDSYAVKAIPVERPVYKFYVQHIFTQDVFLGTAWDADVNWDQALTNYISGMKNELKID